LSPSFHPSRKVCQSIEKEPYQREAGHVKPTGIVIGFFTTRIYLIMRCYDIYGDLLSLQEYAPPADIDPLKASERLDEVNGRLFAAFVGFGTAKNLA